MRMHEYLLAMASRQDVMMFVLADP